MTMPADTRPASRVRWLMVFWIFVIAAVSYLDRNNISIATSAIQAAFGLGNVAMGTVFSAFLLGYAFFQPVAGWLADRFGPYRIVALGLVWWSVFTTATALVPSGFAWSFGALMAVRFFLGLGEAVIFPASNRLVAAWIPRQERGLANGVIFAGVGVGAGIAPPLITYFLITRDWHWAFYASAVVGLGVLVLWLIAVRDRPEAHKRVSPSELAHIRAGTQLSAAASRPASWATILRNRQILLLTLSYSTYGYVAYIFFTWFFKYLSSVRGLDLKSSALYGMLPFIAMSIGSALGGVVSDALAVRFGKRIGRCWVAAVSLILAAVFVVLATQVDDARLAGVILAGGAGALYFSSSAFWTLSADMGGASAGSVSGVMNMGNQTAGMITASLTPLIADHYGWTASFIFAALICLGGGIVWLFIDPDQSLASPTAKGDLP
jgi:ACS family glucarate transporter-like MFS transporter